MACLLVLLFRFFEAIALNLRESQDALYCAIKIIKC